MRRFCLAPLAELMGLGAGHPPVTKLPPCCPNPEPVKAGGAGSLIFLVVELDPAVDLLQHVQLVHKVSWSWAIALKPHQLRRVDDGGNDHLVGGMGVVLVLLFNHLLQLNEPGHHVCHRGAPHKVVKASTDQHPHRPGLPLVVHGKCMGQV